MGFFEVSRDVKGMCYCNESLHAHEICSKMIRNVQKLIWGTFFGILPKVNEGIISATGG